MCVCACRKGLKGWIQNYVCMCLCSVVVAAAVVNGGGVGGEFLCYLRNRKHHLRGWQVVSGYSTSCECACFMLLQLLLLL